MIAGNWTYEMQQKAVWTDESKIEILGSNTTKEKTL